MVSLKDVRTLRLFQSDCCFDFMNVLLVLCMPQLPSIRAACDLCELKELRPRLMPGRWIFEINVVRGTPSRAAAPFRPLYREIVAAHLADRPSF